MEHHDEERIVRQMNDVWHEHSMEWHMTRGAAAATVSTPLSYCLGVSQGLTLALNEYGIAAETVTYETTIFLTHPEQEVRRICELTPRNRSKFGDRGGLDGHVGVETEWGFYDPTFDQFGQQGPWRAPLRPVSARWDTVTLWDDLPRKLRSRDWGLLHHEWDFAVASRHDAVEVAAFYREMSRSTVVTESLAFFLVDRYTTPSC